MAKKFFISLSFLTFSIFAFSQKKDILSLLMQQVSETSLKKNLYFLAGDACQGRMVTTHGDSVASLFVEQWMKQYKLTPAVHNSYRQNVPLIENSSDIDDMTTNGVKETLLDDWIYDWHGNAFRNGVNIKNAPLVFINYGYDFEKYNDYDNIDVKGKVVVCLAGIPAFIRDNLLTSNDRDENATEYIQKGALAALYFPTFFDFNYFSTQQKRNGGAKTFMLKEDIGSYWGKNKSTFPGIYISKRCLDNLLGNKRSVTDSLLNNTRYLEHDPRAFDLHKTISIRVKRMINEDGKNSPNIIGMISGTDATAGFVVFTAHRDHEGQSNGSTWYGADDNGSGTVAMMECEKAISNLVNMGISPKRTILFISTTAEEQGLLGARYFSLHPLVPLNQIKYEINIDMLGRIDSKHRDNNRTDTNYVYPVYYDTLFNFKNVIDEVNNQTTRLVIDDYYLNNKTEEDMINRSDHAIFNVLQIPALWFFTGIHKDYHRPGDTPDKINYALLAERTKLVLGVLWRLANENEQ